MGSSPARPTRRTLGNLAMRNNNDFAALGLIGAAIALLMTVLLPRPSHAASEDEVRWGLHDVSLESTTVVVHSTWSLDAEPAEPVPLASALPAQTELSGATPVRDDQGSIIALALSHGGRTDLETRVPWSHVRRSDALPVPVPQGDSVHRVVLDPALSFSPDPALGLVAQVGHYAPASFDVVARHRFDARTDGNLRHVGAYYVRGEDLLTTGALAGHVVLQRQRMARLMLVAGGIFGFIVLGMVVIHRRLGRRVEVERAEAYLEQEFRILDDADFVPPAGKTQPGTPIPS